MSTRSETVSVDLRYNDGLDEPERGIFRTSVADPDYVEELLLWVGENDDHTGEEAAACRYQINLCGTRRSLYELGSYLIALSRFETADTGYHDHFDELAAPDGKSACELLIHSPLRIAQER